jgi:NTE family protein
MCEQHYLKVGLALGSGAARGGAHLGVIRALNEAGIRVDYVAGTSVGALVGAAYAAGTIDRLERFIQELEWRQMVTFLDVAFPTSGLIDGRKVTRFIDEFLSEQSFDGLSCPLSVVATDLNGSSEVVIQDGDLAKAVRASISIPGIFRPVKKDATILVDGGLVNPVPVTAVRAMGADVVIAVDLSRESAPSEEPREAFRHEDAEPGKSERISVVPEGLRNATKPLIEKLAALEASGLSRIKSLRKKESVPNIAEVLLMSLAVMENRVKEMQFRADPPEVLIRPRVGHVSFLEFHRAKELIDLGYEEARSTLAHWLEEGGNRRPGGILP